MDLRHHDTPTDFSPEGKLPKPTVGPVRGRMQSRPNHVPLQFSLHEHRTQHIVNCFLDAEQASLVDGLWGKDVEIQGLIARDPDLGVPVSVRRISRIHETGQKEAGALLRAKGVLGWPETAPSPAELIRRVRDGQLPSANLLVFEHCH